MPGSRTGPSSSGATSCASSPPARTRPSALGAWPFDLAVVDPPYAERALREAVLVRLGAPEAPGAPAVLRPGSRVVVTHFWKEPPPEVVGLLASERVKRFGETAVAFYRYGEG